MRRRELFSEGVATLREARIESASTAVRLFLAFVLGKEEFQEKEVSSANIEQFRALIAHHKIGYPVSKLIGCRYFWDKPFFVDINVLDPRPDSETLIEAILQTVPADFSGKVLDFGTGSGCLLETLLIHCPHMQGIGVDCSQQALQIAQKNAVHLGVIDRAHFVCSNWGKALNQRRKFDVILSNPPYIARKEIPTLPRSVALYDPFIALDGGEDGLACYRDLVPSIRHFLRLHGHVFLEIDKGQQEAVKEIFNFLFYLEGYRDLSGKVRVLHFSS
ncbi:MAG: peptide chain release factor N(5)-glutamine methyltransferase [Holosporales bacterium]|jgi:release factor glutamine methyltransferase|nr:peptide chain release factor N(5)-glutamine methyltransferase [Holosporales bacterium]